MENLEQRADRAERSFFTPLFSQFLQVEHRSFFSLL